MSKHVSPSQISTFQRCERKWAYSRVRPRTQNRWAAFGTRSHSVAEAWLKDGTPPDLMTQEGRTISAGLEYLPLPGSAAVEHRFDMHLGSVHLMGLIDFMFGFEPGRVICIGDHKTTGDFKNAKSVADLLEDPQRIIYSYWAAHAADVAEVAAVWIYYLRAVGSTKPAARPVVVRESREDLDRRMEPILRVALAIVDRQGAPVDASPRNLAACGDYGGCPYRDECLAGVERDSLTASLTGLLEA